MRFCFGQACRDHRPVFRAFQQRARSRIGDGSEDGHPRRAARRIRPSCHGRNPALIRAPRLDYAQMRRLLACFGRQRRRLIWGNKACRLQQAPNFGSYEISNFRGSKIVCQQFHWCWPLPFSLLVGQLTARWRAKSWHSPTPLNLDLGFAALASRRPGALPREVLKGRHG
jgi:hypothetical protein